MLQTLKSKLAAAIALSLCLSSALAADPVGGKKPAAQGQFRTLEFPHYCVGNLYQESTDSDGSLIIASKPVAAIRTVHVPAKWDRLCLDVNFAGARNLAFLRQLKADDLFSLRLSNNGHGFEFDDSVSQNFEHLTGLHELFLDSSDVGDPTVRRLAKMKKLERLTLNMTLVTSATMPVLRHFTELRELGLNHTRLNNAALENLTDLVHLTYLDLKATGITGSGLKCLRKLTALHELKIGGNKLGDSGMASLPAFPVLARICIDNCATADAGIAALVERCPNLKVLYAQNLPITQAGFHSLGKLKGLFIVTLAGPPRTPNEAKELQALPHLVQLTLTAAPHDQATIMKLLPRAAVEFVVHDSKIPIEVFEPLSKEAKDLLK